MNRKKQMEMVQKEGLDLFIRKNKDYGEASFQMMDSRWAKQTPSRAKELSSIMRSCKA